MTKLNISALLLLHLVELISSNTSFDTKTSICIVSEPCSCETKAKSPFIQNLLEHNNNTDNVNLIKTVLGSTNATEQDMGYFVNCYNQSLARIPRFKQLGYSKHQFINCLELNQNSLETISESLFYGLLINCIDFSKNNITKISRNAFSGLLSSLVVLKLSDNKLTSASTFPVYFASKLAQLQALFLAGNKFDVLVDRSFQAVFSARLKILDLSNNSISCIYEEAFSGLHALTYLNLCKNTLGTNLITDQNCKYPQMKLVYLKELNSLENLQLCWNGLERIEGGRYNFKNNKKLKIINLESNSLRTLKDLFCASDVKSARINYLSKLTTLNLAWNNLIEIKVHDLNCLHNLKELRLNHNKLSYLNPNSFLNLTKLEKLYLNHNPRLVPYPSWLIGLENSLTHLVFNFNQDLKYDYDFEKIVEVLVFKNNLNKLEILDLSESKFEIVYLNLAHLLLTNNQLKRINCLNCSIKYLKYKYDLFTTENRKYSKYEVNIEKVFMDRYKLHTCKRKLLSNMITLDLKSNYISECQINNYNIRDEIDMDLNFNRNYTYDCENMRIEFINNLMYYVNVDNYYCYDTVKAKKKEWQLYNQRKFMSYAKQMVNCTNQASDSIVCSNYYLMMKDGRLILKSGSLKLEVYFYLYSICFFVSYFYL